jgi:hypothetical protein
VRRENALLVDVFVKDVNVIRNLAVAVINKI